MSNKRKLVALGAAAGAALLVRRSRRARARHAAAGIADTIMPTTASEARGESPTLPADEAHAPGHAHLPLATHLQGTEARPGWRSHAIAHQEPEIKRRG
jgi:hypothetical protein